jgi:hypothetical protein
LKGLEMLSIKKIQQIKIAVTNKKIAMFKKYGWVMNHKLTAGDVRLVIETYHELFSKGDKNDQ